MTRGKFLASLLSIPLVPLTGTAIKEQIPPTRIWRRKPAKKFLRLPNGEWDPKVYTYEIHYLEGTLIKGTPLDPVLMDVDRIYITSLNSTKPRIERKLDTPFRLNPNDIWMLTEHPKGNWLMLETRVYAH